MNPLYNPPSFRVDDPVVLANFIRENSFGILFSSGDQGPLATHLPFLVREEGGVPVELAAHMARPNPHWQHLNGKVLVVFPGPHAYVSPTWYQETNVVPTWNYVAVHVYGRCSLIEDPDEVRRHLDALVHFYESGRPQPWQTASADDFVQKLMRGVVTFRIHISRIEGKWKLNQNHSVQRQERVEQALRQTGDAGDRAVADLMAANLARQNKNRPQRLAWWS